MLVAAIVASVLTACSSSQTVAQHQPSASLSTHQPGNDVSASPCEAAQRAVIRRVRPEWKFHNVANGVLGSEQSRSARSARIWRRLATAMDDKLTIGGCTQSEVRDAFPAPNVIGPSMDESELTRVIVAVQRWIKRIHPRGGARWADWLSRDIYCLRHRARFASVSYEVKSTPTHAGRDVWLVLYIHNKTEHGMMGELYGGMDIVGNIWPTPPLMSYGDENGAKRHSTVGHMVGDVGGHRLHVTSAGHLAHIHLAELLYLHHRSCMYAVSRR